MFVSRNIAWYHYVSWNPCKKIFNLHWKEMCACIINFTYVATNGKSELLDFVGALQYDAAQWYVKNREIQKLELYVFSTIALINSFILYRFLEDNQ